MNDLLNRFNQIEKNRTETDCSLWAGTISHVGYGVFSFKSKIMYAHRAAYILKHGDIPKGFYICHSCDNKLCVNIDHCLCHLRKR